MSRSTQAGSSLLPSAGRRAARRSIHEGRLPGGVQQQWTGPDRSEHQREPLHPDPEVGPKHADDLRRAIDLAELLDVRRVVTMSGVPAAHPGGTAPSWVVNPWDSAYLDVLEYQWHEVALPFWEDIQRRAAAAEVKICIEMHPHNLVFNPTTLQRLVNAIGATHVGAEMDPSHLFWQGIDPVAAVERLGPLVFHAAAKDTRINTRARPDPRRPRRPVPPCPRRIEPGRPRRALHAQPVASR
ncbi:sugar phosphate isomerase/epimerase [Nocardioides sp.]|uniref:sugar phosphate isomerase/epimerase family protein n=1 Tax=Nocardioides sp. TaxID=35761 RepID=UPI002736A698|nr:sugar phosphate isomerase/epimerase [Nocardioides sp.]MDP3892593.1 sugar phosphate isomerase/epimerase [Nocardioides sp.]